jgi:hypothetical protein
MALARQGRYHVAPGLVAEPGPGYRLTDWLSERTADCPAKSQAGVHARMRCGHAGFGRPVATNAARRSIGIRALTSDADAIGTLLARVNLIAPLDARMVRPRGAPAAQPLSCSKLERCRQRRLIGKSARKGTPLSHRKPDSSGK